jgi:uncharacterized coiled-coil protein SlyX
MSDEKETSTQGKTVKTPEFQAALREMIEKLRALSPHWTEDEIEEARKRIEREADDKLSVRLTTIMIMLEKSKEDLRKTNEMLKRMLNQMEDADAESRRHRIERGGNN